MPRISEDECFLSIAKILSQRSTCKRRQYGSVIVKYPKNSKRARLVAAGYNGAASGLPNCSDSLEDCFRKKNNMHHNTDYSECVSTHSELNSCLQAGNRIDDTCVLYLYGFDLESNKEVDNPTPCQGCQNALRNVGITKYVNNKGSHILPMNIGIFSQECG